MYISAEAIAELESRFGVPSLVRLSYEMSAAELQAVQRSQKHGRSHDVTLYIAHDDGFVVIKKPMYPPGAYRAPSGGINPGEPFEQGALREAHEETGLEIALEAYILRAAVRFRNAGESIDWTTHVFLASVEGGRLEPEDTHEIVEARVATLAELAGPIRSALLSSGSIGLRYRAELNDLVEARLRALGVVR